VDVEDCPLYEGVAVFLGVQHVEGVRIIRSAGKHLVLVFETTLVELIPRNGDCLLGDGDLERLAQGTKDTGM